jgi:hypothetical protein
MKTHLRGVVEGLKESRFSERLLLVLTYCEIVPLVGCQRRPEDQNGTLPLPAAWRSDLLHG